MSSNEGSARRQGGSSADLPVRVLVVGGSDPSGGAGTDVDRAALHDQGAACDAVLSACTDQDDAAVRSVGARDPEAWLAEAFALVAGEWGSGASAGGRALKFGLLPGVSALRAAARLVQRLRSDHPDLPVVLDPVLASSSGFEFLGGEALGVLREELLPCGPVLTPNLPEAVRLAGGDEGALEAAMGEPDRRPELARALLDLGASGVVLKGGHGTERPARDLVLEPGREPRWIRHERLEGPGIRGSGCRHASVLACALAQGLPLLEAAERAARYVAGCIRARARES